MQEVELGNHWAWVEKWWALVPDDPPAWLWVLFLLYVLATFLGLVHVPYRNLRPAVDCPAVGPSSHNKFD